tara:strand:+ start:1017 stop:1406 length:390 start_codon:yes stop_codon:yes gene_type:complete
MRNTFVILSLVISLFFCCNKNIKTTFKNISSNELEVLINENDVKLIDVRRPSEFNSGHIENAINIDYYGGNFSKIFDNLDKSQAIVLYCKSGRRSSKSAVKLVEKGFNNVYNLNGGFEVWAFKGKDIQY